MWGKPKYGNKKVIYDGEIFDSKKELQRYMELTLLQKAGKIQKLERQVKFVLIPAQREPDTTGPRGGVKKGKVIENECTYIADFVYIDNDTQRVVVEDTKGFRTKDYIVKRKLMRYMLGLTITEI